MRYLFLYFSLLSAGFSFEEIIREYEQRHDIPPNLLWAIAVVESGRSNNGQTRPWPWTVRVNGKGYYCPTKAQAIALVQYFQNRGVRNIDVGCMQINLKSHPFVFKSLSIAFDEVTNIAYAAKFLKGLYNRHKSWAKAVAYYHSTNPLFYRSYVRKVYKTLRSSPLPPPLLQGLVRFSPYRPESASAFKPNDLPLVAAKPSVKPFIKVRSYQIKLSAR